MKILHTSNGSAGIGMTATLLGMLSLALGVNKQNGGRVLWLVGSLVCFVVAIWLFRRASKLAETER